MAQDTNTNYTLDKLKIYSLSGGEIDLKPLMINMEIYEDIHSPFLQAQVDVYETESVVEMLPIVGDEWVECIIINHGIHNTNRQKIEFKLDVYRIEQEQQGDHKQLTFRINLISQSFKKNGSRRNRKFYRGTQDAIVADIVGAQLEGKLVRSDACMFEEEYIFPNWHPISCINQMRINSKSDEYGDPDYVFYEDMEGFHYLSMSYMIDPLFDQIYPTMGIKFRSQIPTEYVNTDSDFNVEEHHKKFAFDVIENTHKGMYGATLIHHDVTNRVWREDASNYLGTFGKFMHNAPVPLTKIAGGMDNEKNRMLYMPMNGIDNPGVYQDEFYRDQRKELVIRQLQTEQNTMVLEINAEPEMRVGRPLDFELLSIAGGAETDSKPNKKLSGFFLVTKVRHFFDRDFYTQFVEMSKDSYKT